MTIPKPTEPETLWHYTKLDVLDKMFPPKFLKNYEENKEYKEGKISLRFTNCRFTNDPTESLTLREITTKNKNKIINLFKNKNISKNFNYDINDKLNVISDNYIFSATSLEDSMIFWGKDYARTNGMAIGFNNTSLFERVIYLDDFDDKRIEDVVNIMLNSYELDKKVKNDLCVKFPDYKEYIEDIIFYHLNDFIDFNSIFCKNKSWKHEAEFRIILKNDGEEFYQNPILPKPLKDTIFGGKLNPKIECFENKIKKVCYKLYDKDIVNSIMLGPDCKPEYEEAVKFHLITNGYDNISVSRSQAFNLKDTNKE